jgi:hypothetical protein
VGTPVGTPVGMGVCLAFVKNLLKDGGTNCKIRCRAVQTVAERSHNVLLKEKRNSNNNYNINNSDSSSSDIVITTTTTELKYALIKAFETVLIKKGQTQSKKPSNRQEGGETIG